MRLLGNQPAARSSCSCSLSSSRRCSMRGAAQAGGDPAAGLRARLALAVDASAGARQPHAASHLAAHELQVALGRQSEDRIDTRVHFALPPPQAVTSPVRARRTPRGRRCRASRRPILCASGSRATRWPRCPGEGLQRVGCSVDIVGVESRLSTGLARPDLYNWYSASPGGAPARAEGGRLLVRCRRRARLPRRRAEGQDRRSRSGARRGTRSTDDASRGSRTSWRRGASMSFGSGCRSPTARASPQLPDRQRDPRLGGEIEREPSTYVDTWHLLDDAHGRYTAYLRVHGKLTLMRLPDGVHYTPAAGDLVAEQVLAVLRRSYLFRDARACGRPSTGVVARRHVSTAR